MDYHFAKPL
ncbi:hypothetical protein CIB84_015683 [Bambusicola thoracicus]|uniref:Uncharacterized protein n=1 Tax=Bambusicola thoracicus TaxID=9083 RepID=A0A2P4S8Z3_BAMTH|nr:hypothetical protein CIB84_015683 [Bambusicola thoracicus]